MNEIPISPNLWKLAQAILTQKQLVVLELREKRGFSWNQLAINFNCTRSNVREIHRAASKRMLDAIEAAGGIEEAYARALGAEAVDRHGEALVALADEETLEEKRELAYGLGYEN